MIKIISFIGKILRPPPPSHPLLQKIVHKMFCTIPGLSQFLGRALQLWKVRWQSAAART